MFAVICLPDFELQAALRHEPELHSQSVALVEGEAASAAKAFVLQCTEKAGAAGVVAGLTAPQAQARCGELLLRPRSLHAEKGTTDILLQTAYAFSPHLEHTAPGICTIDLRGLDFSNTKAGRPALFGTTMSRCENTPPGAAQQSFLFFHEAASTVPSSGKDEDNALLIEWAQKIITALQPLHLRAQVGLAATPSLALLAARAAKPVRMVDRVDTFFHSLPLAALEPSPHLGMILHRWGIHTAGAFLALGKDAIVDRLGAEALELFARASTNTIRPLNIIAPADTFEERSEFEVQIETIEPLLFVLRRFVEQLATRIAFTYRVVAELHLTLTLENGALHEHTFTVPAPTAQVDTLFRMLHTHLENLRTEASITSLKLSATPARPETQQFGLFESSLRDPNHFHETLARLTALLGSERVGTPLVEATHQPDSFRMQTPEFGSKSLPLQSAKVEGPIPSGLCLRRFRPALHADVELKNGEPAFINTLVARGTVRRVRGPWRLSGTWWDPRRWTRQEWDVETRDGVVYRLLHANGDWRLEGVYD